MSFLKRKINTLDGFFVPNASKFRHFWREAKARVRCIKLLSETWD
jgi:hypothetical protein